MKATMVGAVARVASDDVGAVARVASDDEIVLNVPRELLADHRRGDVVTLDCARAKGEFEALEVDPDAQTLTVRPHHRVESSARPNRRDRRAMASGWRAKLARP